MEAAGYNLFLVPSEAILMTCSTDFGTGSDVHRTWAAMMRGDDPTPVAELRAVSRCRAKHFWLSPRDFPRTRAAPRNA